MNRLGGIPVRRLAGFLTLPLISAIAPFLVLPVLLDYVGTQAWAGIAIGQSVGTGVSTLVLIGWTVVGPALVAAEPERQRFLYTESLVSRLTVFCVAAPAGMVVSAVLAPRSAWVAAALMTLASASLGLSANWFFVGTGRPFSIARYDTVPRVTAAAAAAVLVALFPAAWLYPAVLLATSAALLVVVSARHWERGPIMPLRTTRRVVRAQWAAVGVSVQAALNATLPMILVAAVAPAAVAGFAALDRITLFAIFVLQPVGQAFQGWVAEPCANQVYRRRTAFTVTASTGLLLAAGFLVTAHLLLQVLFAGRIEVHDAAILCSAGIIVGVALGTTLGFHFLVPLGMSGWLALSTTVSIVMGSGAMLVLAPQFGVTGASLSVLLAEVCVVATQTLALVTRRSQRPVAIAPLANRLADSGCHEIAAASQARADTA